MDASDQEGESNDSQPLKFNRVPISGRLKMDNSLKKKRKKDAVDLDINYTDSSQSNDFEIIPEVLLKEPGEKVKLIERAIGYFNADNDVGNQKNELNTSIEIGPPYVCKICDAWFYMGSKLKVHYILNHELFHCEICSLLFQDVDSKNDHVKDYHSPMFCEICQETHHSLRELLTHYDLMHDSTTCTFCGLLLQPRSHLEDHIMKKHQVAADFILNDLKMMGEKVVQDVENPLEFYCSLCKRNREAGVMFGHLNSYHKLTLTILLSLLIKSGSVIKCEGVQKSMIQGQKIDTNLTSVSTNQKMIARNHCKVCTNKFSHRIPKDFHMSYCFGKISCRYCDKQFPNIEKKDSHCKKLHSKFTCKQNCQDLAYSSEECLQKHYNKTHNNTSCRFCDKYILLSDYEVHIQEKHKYKAVVMKNFKDTLFEIVDKDAKHVAICCVCDEDITRLTDQPKNMYMHYELIHNMSKKRICRQMTTKPVLEEYDEFYREINEQIKKENDSDDEETDPEEIEEEIINKIEDAGSSELGKTFEHLEEEIDSDIDIEKTEGLVDSEDEIEKQLSCEICQTEFSALITLTRHLSDKHKLKINCKNYRCLYCKSKFLTEQMYTNHLKRHGPNAKEEDVDDDAYKCDICKINVPNDLKRFHLLSTHKEVLNDEQLQEIGLKCRFCEEKFWEKCDVNSHEVKKHYDNSTNSFQQCYLCKDVFRSQNSLKLHCLHTHPDDIQYEALFYKCLLCNLTYPTFDHLRQHFKQEHPLLKSFRCPVPQCFKMSKKRSFIVKHLATPHILKPERTGLSKTCEICNKEFKTYRSVSIHKLMKHTEVKYGGYQCKICNEKFQTTEIRYIYLFNRISRLQIDSCRAYFYRI